ncbi:MAG: antitoxin [Candidatus Omnitrophica bacterium]|nr:antitoxin [Candidatus Omnitrophota bacterium]
MARLKHEERKLLASVEQGEWRPAGKAVMKRYVQVARHTLKKDRRVNIRLAQVDLEGIQTKAFGEGLPYQTLIASILHKYVTGSLVTKR